MLKQKKGMVCNYCGSMIEISEDKFVMVGTYHKEKILDETYFHFLCWKSYFRERVAQKVSGMKNSALNLLGSLRERVGNFRGSGKIEEMLNTPITKEEKEEWNKKNPNKKKKK